MKDYSLYQNKSLCNVRICDYGDVEFDTKDWVLKARTAVEKHISEKKYLIALGGEHTITLPIIQVLKERHKNFSLVHIDAHCDLRDEYLEQKIEPGKNLTSARTCINLMFSNLYLQ
jgi:agmatinase